MTSGDTLVTFTALHNEPPAASAATLDTRNQHVLVDFDATNNEYAVFSDTMPRNYAAGGVTVYAHVAFSSATSGSACLAIAWERIGEVQDMDADSFATAACVQVGAPATAGQIIAASLSFANGAAMDSIAVGEGFRLQVARMPGDAWDTATGDGELRFLELKES